MDAAAWNAKYPLGTVVIVTLADRRRRLARTISLAQHIGQHDFIEVDQIRPGSVLLGWCWPVSASGLAFLARRALSRPHPLDAVPSAGKAVRGASQLTQPRLHLVVPVDGLQRGADFAGQPMRDV